MQKADLVLVELKPKPSLRKWAYKGKLGGMQKLNSNETFEDPASYIMALPLLKTELIKGL